MSVIAYRSSPESDDSIEYVNPTVDSVSTKDSIPSKQRGVFRQSAVSDDYYNCRDFSGEENC